MWASVCQMVHFQTKNHNLGTFWKVLQLQMLVFVMAILSILRPIGIHILWPFGTFCVNFGTFFSVLVHMLC
jgi:hypothetical protein